MNYIAKLMIRILRDKASNIEEEKYVYVQDACIYDAVRTHTRNAENTVMDNRKTFDNI